MHRLFVALPCPPPLVEALAPAMEGGPPQLRWVAEEELHCTLRFIGEVERPMAEAIGDALETVTAPPLQTRIDGVGIFDHRRRGALWARLRPKTPLKILHHKIDHALVRLGLPPERRTYLPHVTLARWSGGAIDARSWAERHAGLASAPVTIDTFTLFESHLGRHGPTYQTIARFQLAA